MATTRKKASAEKITLVPLTDLYERADHPIRMRDDAGWTPGLNPCRPLPRPALRDGVSRAGVLRDPRSLSRTFFFTQLQSIARRFAGVLPC